MAETNNYRISSEYRADVTPAVRALGNLRESMGHVLGDQNRITAGFRTVGEGLRAAKSEASGLAEAIRRSVVNTDQLIGRLAALHRAMRDGPSGGNGSSGFSGGGYESARASEFHRASRSHRPMLLLEHDWDHGNRPVDGDPARRTGMSNSRDLVMTGARNSNDSGLSFNARDYEDRESRNRRIRDQLRDRDIDLDSRERMRRLEEADRRRQERADRAGEDDERRERRHGMLRRVATAPIRGIREAGSTAIHALPHVLGVGAVFGGIAGLDQLGRFVGGSYRLNAENENILTNLRSNQGFTPQAESQFRAIIQQGLKANPTLDVGMATETLSRLYQNSAGNMEAVSALAPSTFRSEATFLMRHNGQREAAVNDSIATMRAADLRNVGFGTPEYVQRYQRAIRFNMQVSGAEPGFLTGQNIFQGMLSGGAATDAMSDEGLAYAARGMAERASRTGMQLQGFNGLFAGRHVQMSKRDAAYFRHAGLIGPNDEFVDQQELTANPVKWIHDHLLQDGQGHDLPASRIAENMSHTQRQNVRALEQYESNNWQAITGFRDRVIENNPDRAYASYTGSAQGALDRSSASFNNFSAAVGRFAQGPGIRFLNTFSTSLDRLTAQLNAHPELADRAFNRIETFFGRIYHLVEIADRVATRIDGWVGRNEPTPGAPTAYAYGSDGERIAREMWARQQRQQQVERRATPNQPDMQRNPQFPARTFTPH